MPKNQKSINTDIFSFLKSRGYKPTPYDSAGKVVPIVDEAEVFQFSFIKDGKDYGPVTVTIDGLNDLVVYYGDSVSSSPKDPMSAGTHTDLSWMQLVKLLKKFAKNRQLGFVLSDQDDLKYDMAKRQHVSEGYHALGKQKSYNDSVPNVKIVLKHNKVIGEGEQRFRHIEKIFIENTEGERILAPTKKPGIARVFARHIAEGGLANDEKWNHIKSLCEEYNKMSGFVRATRNRQFNESAMLLINESTKYYESLRENLKRLSGKRGYHAYFESWTPTLLEDDESEEDLTEVFKNSSLDPRIESALPILSKLKKNIKESPAVEELEEWADSIVGEALMPSDPQDEEDLITLLTGDEPLTAGPDGKNAINALSGFLEDSELSEKLKHLGEHDPDADVFDTVVDWMSSSNDSGLKRLAEKIKQEKEEPATPEPTEQEPAATPPEEPATPPVKENISMKQKKVGQLGPTEKISKSNPTRGKLVGVAEGWEKELAAKNRERMRQEKAAQKAMSAPKASASPKLTLDSVWRKVEDVVSQIYPDGDPMDWLAPWLKKHGISDFKIGEIVDRAAKKNGYKDLYDYWDSMGDLPKQGMSEGDPGYNKHSLIGKIRRGMEADKKGWGQFGKLLSADNEKDAEKAIRKGNRYYNMTRGDNKTPGGFPKTTIKEQGADDTVYPNAEVIKTKGGNPAGEIYQDEDGWAFFDYRSEMGKSMLGSREEAIEEFKHHRRQPGSRARAKSTIHDTWKENPVPPGALDEGQEERKQNSLWAQITDYETRAKKTKDPIKKDHYMKMASDLRGKLKTSDDEVKEGQDVLEAMIKIINR